MLRELAGPGQLTKSALLVGMGETDDEVMQTLAELRENGCQMVAIGQYLQPTAGHPAVVEYRTPGWFEALDSTARSMGFDHVASGPLVRSSYRASELFVKGRQS